MMGIGESKTSVHIIDYGLAKRFQSIRDSSHIQRETNRSAIGTKRYVSRNVLLGTVPKISDTGGAYKGTVLKNDGP